MTSERISGLGDPRVAAYRNMSDAERLRDQGLFVAESRAVVQRLLQDRRYRVRSLLVNDAAAAALAPAVTSRGDDLPMFVCETDDFRRLTGHALHRGCLALVERPVPIPFDDLLASARTVIVLEGITDPDNVGSIFRNAAALGSDAVVLSPTCRDSLYRKAIRTSMGAVLTVPFARAANWSDTLASLRTRRFTIVALTPRAPSETIAAFAARPRPERLALIVGTEGSGLSAAVESAADDRVRIPISEAVDSLNVGVAVGIALYAIRSRH